MLRSGDGMRMAISPKESPVYGGETLVIAFSEDSSLPDAGTDMYIVFSGSSSRHITLAQRKNRNTLHSIIPGHNAFETVSLTVQTRGSDGGKVFASCEFTYREDSTHNIARFLANSSHDPNALNHVDLSDEDHSTLDQRLRLAFENLDLPDSWHVLESSEHLVQAPRETLLHFAARHRLTDFALYLLNKPSRELQIALRLPNQHNELPINIARDKGLDNLAKEMQNQTLGINKDFDIDVFCRGPLTARRHRSGTISVSYNLKESYRSIDEQIQMLQEVLTFTRVDDPPQKQVIMHHQRTQGNSTGFRIQQEDEDEDEEEEEDDEDDDEFVECLDRTPTQSSCDTVLQASIQKLQQITSKVQDFQDINRQELMGQASRRENLSRFSCSCPSLTDKYGPSNSVMKPAVSLRAIASFNEEDEYEDSGESEGCTEPNEDNMEGGRGTINSSTHDPQRRKSSLSSGDEDPYMKTVYNPDWAIPESNHRVSNRNQRHNDVSVSRSKSLGHLAEGQLSDDEFQDAPDRTPSTKSLQSDSNGQTKTDSQTDEMVSDSRSGIGNQLVVDGFPDSSSENLDMVNLGPLDSVSKVRMRSHLNKDREKRQLRSVSMFEPTMPLTHSTSSRPMPKTIGDHQISKITSEEVPQESDELEGDQGYTEFIKSRRRKQARMSLTEFLSDPRNFVEGEEPTDINKKEQPTKHRPPGLMLRKFSFLKQKGKKEKKEREEMRPKHQFVPVSFSTSKKCHHCEKSMTNKDALQCQICQVSVHNSSCKDNVVACTKPSRHPKQNRIVRYFGHSLIKPTAVELQRSTTNYKERGNSTKPNLSLQATHSVRERPKSMAVSSHIHLSSPPDLKSQQRSSLISSRNEDSTDADSVSALLYPTTLSSAHSVSIESLEDLQYDYDEDIAMKGPEPESWSAMMDKKTLKKMNAKDIKRQDHIFELIQTEKHHLRTLKIMQKIFSYGMQHELHMEQDLINKMFPSLKELVEIAASFHSWLKERQSQAKVVECIGDVLVDQFDMDCGEKMVQSYSYFCSRQKEAVQTYKDLLKTDRKFQLFIKKCSNNALCRRWSIPECILSAMHRLTKYPLLIQAIIKQTKPSKADYRPLQKAATCVKSILSRVDEQVRQYEQSKKLWDIYNKVEGRTYGMMKSGKRFEKKDIVSKDRKLRHEGALQLKSARGKYTEILGVLLTDVFLLLEINNQKYTFISQDQKAPVISLHKLMVREVATDNRSIYLISTASSGPEMYEVKCESDDRKKWKAKIEEAVKDCPAPDEAIPVNEIDEQIRLAEIRAKRIKQFISDLQEKDNQLKSLANEKSNLVQQLSKVIRNDDSDIQQSEEMLFMKSSELLLKSLEEVTHLTSSVCSINNMGLGRSASSAGEHFSGTSQLPVLPKRAETFSGFDSSVKDHAVFDFGLPGTNLQKRYARKNSTENRSSSSPNLSKEQSNSMDAEDSEKGGSDPTLNPDTRSLAGMKMGGQINKSQMGRSLSDAADWKAMKEREKMFAALRTDPNQTIDSDNSQGDLSSSIDSTPGGITHLPTNETVNATIRLTQYLNSLLILTTHQETELQSLHHQLSDAKMTISKLTQHTNQLEEEQEQQFNTCKQVEIDQEEVHLMQQKLREERQEFEEEKEKLQSEIENQNVLFISQQELLVKETAEKERLQHKLEKLENHFKVLKEQEKSSKNIKEERGDKWKLAKENNNQSNNSSRKPRSQSDFSLCDIVEGSVQSSTSDSDGGSNRRRGNEKAVPIHLLSATNELDTSSEIKQKLPFKLSSLSSSSSLQGKRHSSSSSIGTSSSVPSSSGLPLSSLSSKRHLSSSSIGSTNTNPQMLPMKLANLSSSPSEKKSNHRTKSPKSKSKKDHSSLENNGRTPTKNQGEQDVIYF